MLGSIRSYFSPRGMKKREVTPLAEGTEVKSETATTATATATAAGSKDASSETTPDRAVSDMKTKDETIKQEQQANKAEITEAMLKEEQALEAQTAAAHKKRMDDFRKQEASSSSSSAGQSQTEEEKKRFQRLQALMDKSKIYTSILAEKLQQRQVEMMSSATTPAGTPAPEEEEAPVPAVPVPVKKTTRGRKKGAASKKAKEEKARGVASALAQGEEGDSGVNATATPSASARQPELVTGGILKDYQLAGLEWMVSLYENGLNGILADEMGLGKTLQTIAFLAFLRGKGIHGPFLVVAPLSTLSNWVSEFHRFTPDIPVCLYHGSPEDRADIRAKYFGKTNAASFPVIVTSYEMITAAKDRGYLAKVGWKYVIVDEAHRLKNFNSALMRELKSYYSDNRLLLTGTPLQNNLAELWSLLNFLLPEIFGDLDEFQSWFDFSALQEEEGGGNIAQHASVVSSLHSILKPFLLRRMKVDVLGDSLPPKREYLLYAPLTKKQNEIYQATLKGELHSYLLKEYVAIEAVSAEDVGEDDFLESTQKKIETRKRKIQEVDDGADSPARRSKRALKEVNYGADSMSDQAFVDLALAIENGEVEEEEEEIVMSASEEALKRAQRLLKAQRLQMSFMQLRKAANHPYLFDLWPTRPGTEEYLINHDTVNLSGKMLLLNRMLEALFAKDHKVLVFSQFTTMLDVIQVWAEQLKGWPTYRIDGEVIQEDRREMIKDFQNPDSKSGVNLFLLSTRAGGLGINLTAADTVVIFDSDWNPQQDLQAMDRAHRIGQKKPVVVYRFASANTIETRLLAAAESKRQLEKLVIRKGKFKSLLAPGGNEKENDEPDLAEILRREAEKINIKDQHDEILTDEQLAKLMDRSPEAYENAKKGLEGHIGGAFKIVETKSDQIANA
ncbi:Putative ATPase [Saitoella coloradoensis]